MSTMLDAYDAQMLDYHAHDLDVQMNTSTGSDSWVQEATMEDDGFTHKTTFENVSIEIDMDDYDATSAEYDISKDVQHTSEEDGITDIVDVEVYDVSQIHSPAATPHPVSAETHEVANGAEEDQHDTEHGSLQTAEEVQLDDRASPNATTAEQTAEVLATYKTEQVASPDAVNGQVESNVLVEIDSHGASIFVPATEDQGVGKVHAPWTNFPASDAHENVINTEEGGSATTVVEIPEDKGQGHNQEHHPQDPDHQDPHEISEGVYIDPPPPVLLTIDIIGHYDIYLFNEIFDAETVEVGEGEQDSTPSIVLLQDRPTLYYENLANLFEALRQDTFLSNITEVSESELVLEAYDLRLVMPEDNCYVRGISLHDVNVLHDSYGLTGPLRLRLRLELPRFIILYQRLQDRTALLSVESHTDPNNANEQFVQNESGHVYQHSEEIAKKDGEASHDSNIDDSVPNQEALPEDGERHNGGDEQKPIAQRASWSDENTAAQYSDNAETDDGVAAAAEPEATYTADGLESAASEVTDAASDASTKEVGEVLNSEANQGHATNGATPRLQSPEVSEEKVAREEDLDFSKPDEGEIAQNVDLIAPLMEEPALDTNSADDSHEVTRTELTREHELAPSEEHDTVGETVDSDLFGSESWDAQFGGDGEPDTTWDHELDQDEDEEERNRLESTSVESSVTLSSTLSSKRSFQELDEDERESPIHPPGFKKPRTE